MIWNWLRRHSLLADIGLVALLLAPTIVAASRHAHPGLGIGLGILETLPLLWRRRQPVAVVVLVTSVTVAMIALGVWLLPFQVAIALYTVAATAERRLAVASGIGSIVAVAAADAAAPQLRFGDVTWRVVFLGAAWLLGDSIGSRRAYVREIEEKAERLEREHEAQARRAAAEEQARIARELHDVVAHALSVIVIQAAAADDALEDEPESPARAPVRAIETAARSALGDLRRVLGVLRDGAADYEPQPALAQLDPLIERVRGTGLPVELEIEGESRPLPAAVELSAYRIVQEALTNTLKHAGATHVKVRVRYGERLELEIHDDGQGGNGASAGNGLIGMRERAAMLGGELSAAPAPGGGFVVHARIPIELT